MPENPVRLQESTGESWQVWICPECGARFGEDYQAQGHAVAACDPDSWPWEPVGFVSPDVVERLRGEDGRMVTDEMIERGARALGEAAHLTMREYAEIVLRAALEAPDER